MPPADENQPHSQGPPDFTKPAPQYGQPPMSGPPPGSMSGPPPGYGPPAQQPGYGAPSPYGPPMEDTTLSVLVHLSLFVFGLIAPLVLYLIAKDDPSKQMTRHHAAEALNFHLTLLIAGVVSIILIFVIIGIFMVLALAIWATVLAIMAAVAAGRREPYRYPLTIRFVH